MDQLEKVEKIREKTGVSYEDAVSSQEVMEHGDAALNTVSDRVFREAWKDQGTGGWHLYDDSAGDIERAGTGTGCLRAVLQEENIR